MGRVGYVRVREPKYGSGITGCAQRSLCDYLDEHGLEVNDPDDGDTAYSNRWEIAIPERERKNPKPRERQRYYDYGPVRKAIADLRANPGAVRGYEGDPCGEVAAALLEEGLAAAKRTRSGCIYVDWW